MYANFLRCLTSTSSNHILRTHHRIHSTAKAGRQKKKKKTCIKSWQFNRDFIHCGISETMKGVKVRKSMAEAYKSASDYKMEG